MPTQVKLAIACCFSLVALISYKRETVQLPSFPTFARTNGMTFFQFFFQTIPDKSVGTRSKFSPPPTFNVDNRVIFFPFCWKKRDIFQHWLGGMGDMWYSSSVPTNFVWDCRPFIFSLSFGCNHWPSTGLASSSRIDHICILQLSLMLGDFSNTNYIHVFLIWFSHMSLRYKLQSLTKVLGTPGSDNWNMRWQLFWKQ